MGIMRSDPTAEHIKVEVEVESSPTENVLGFFLPDAFSSALRESGYNVREEVAMLVDSIRRDPTVWGKLAGMRYLDGRMKDVVSMGGLLQVLEARATSEGQDGVKKTIESKSFRLLEEKPPDQRLLECEEVKNDPGVIEVEYETRKEPEGVGGDNQEICDLTEGEVPEGDDYDPNDLSGEAGAAAGMRVAGGGHFKPRDSYATQHGLSGGFKARTTGE